MPTEKVSPARRAAFEILKACALAKTDPASLLHQRPTRRVAAVDLDLATEIVYGVLRWQNRLDYVLSHHARRPLESIDVPVLLSLRIGLYQIHHLSRVPARAAVNESVALARLHGPTGSSSFVNAVLRSVCRNPERPAFPQREQDVLAYLTITLSHPEWLSRRYLREIGPNGAEARELRQNRQPPIDLRVEPPLEPEEAVGLLEHEGVRATVFPIAPRCLRVLSGRPTGTSLHRRGSIFVQEAGSQLIPYLLGLTPTDRILDACAAPGAKATAMSRMSDRALVIAVERRPRRLALLAHLSKKLRCPNVVPVAGDAGELPFRGNFSRILLDAPCSSLGTLGRNPDIRWRVREEDLPAHAATQRRLLESCARLLAPGGRLVYSTCSTEREENEEVVHGFLSDHPGFRLAAPPPSFPREARHLLTSEGTLRTLPERDDMDGYFAAALEKS